MDPQSTDHTTAVRPASQDDITAIAALYAHYVEHTVATFDLDAPTEETWRARLRAAQRAGHPWLVAEAGGTLAGYATAAEFRPKRAYRTSVETTIYLRPDAGGRGLGTLLYGALLDVARAAGFRTAICLITLPNPASVALHERLGFEALGVLAEVGHKLGEWRDVGIWQRALAGPAPADPTQPPRGPHGPAGHS